MLYKLLAQYETRKFSGEISRGVLEAEWKIKTTKKKDLKNRKHLISCLVPCWPRLHTSCLIPQLLGPTLHYCLHVLVICLYAGWSIHQIHISPTQRQGRRVRQCQTRCTSPCRWHQMLLAERCSVMPKMWFCATRARWAPPVCPPRGHPKGCWSRDPLLQRIHRVWPTPAGHGARWQLCGTCIVLILLARGCQKTGPSLYLHTLLCLLFNWCTGAWMSACLSRTPKWQHSHGMQIIPASMWQDAQRGFHKANLKWWSNKRCGGVLTAEGIPQWTNHNASLGARGRPHAPEIGPPDLCIFPGLSLQLLLRPVSITASVRGKDFSLLFSLEEQCVSVLLDISSWIQGWIFKMEAAQTSK